MSKYYLSSKTLVVRTMAIRCHSRLSHLSSSCFRDVVYYWILTVLQVIYLCYFIKQYHCRCLWMTDLSCWLHQLTRKPSCRWVSSLLDQAKACQKLLQFDVRTTLSLTILLANNTGLLYIHMFSCCCVRNLRNPEKFSENSNLSSPRSSILVSIKSAHATCY